MTDRYRNKQREELNVYDPVSQETMKGLMFLGTSKLYSLNYLSWSLLPSMKKTGVSSRHLTQLRICRGAFLGKKYFWHSLAYGQLLIGDGCPLVCHTHQLEQKLCSMVTLTISLGSCTLLKRNQAQINLSLCSYTQTCVSIDASASYSPKFIQKENIHSVGQNFSSLPKLPVQCCWVCKTQEGFLHTEKTFKRSSAGWRCHTYCTGSDEPAGQSCSPVHGRFTALTSRGQT